MFHVLISANFKNETKQKITAVCTTEIGRLAMKYDELTAMDCMIATLSVDPVKSHNEWLRDVVAHCENEIEVKFPIIGTFYQRKIHEADDGGETLFHKFIRADKKITP